MGLLIALGTFGLGHALCVDSEGPSYLGKGKHRRAPRLGAGAGAGAGKGGGQGGAGLNKYFYVCV